MSRINTSTNIIGRNKEGTVSPIMTNSVKNLTPAIQQLIKVITDSDMKIDGDCVQVFDDVKRRPQFRWIHRSNLRKYNRVAVKWPVLHIDGVSKAVRSSNFPPNDLILDTRFSPAVVRPSLFV